MSQNYEKLYNDLKIEYDQAQKDNDEICKEYETTIQMLTESVNNYQKEKDSFQTRITQLENDIKKYQKEKESLTNKNKDKIIDIQNLNKLNEKLKEDIKNVLDEKHLNKTKIITLENDNDHYQNKLRQNEALIEDLNNQLESALEENITLQTEFELYKQQNEEALIRKDQEIKDFKNDLSNKEKIIQRLNDKRASIRELKKKFLLPRENLEQYQRKFTDSITLEDLKKNLNNNNKIEKNIAASETKLITPLSNSTTRYPRKFMEIYRKSIRESNNTLDQMIQKKDTIKNNIDLMINTNIGTTENIMLVKKNSKDKENILASVNTLKEGTIVNGDLEGIETEDKNNKEGIEDDESTASDKRCFEDLVICDEKDFNIIPIKKLMNDNKKKRDKKLADNLRNMLLRIQKRKEALINHQKINNKKLENFGFKMKY